MRNRTMRSIFKDPSNNTISPKKQPQILIAEQSRTEPGRRYTPRGNS